MRLCLVIGYLGSPTDKLLAYRWYQFILPKLNAKGIFRVVTSSVRGERQLVRCGGHPGVPEAAAVHNAER